MVESGKKLTFQVIISTMLKPFWSTWFQRSKINEPPGKTQFLLNETSYEWVR
jgi:hypothetical protein